MFGKTLATSSPKQSLGSLLCLLLLLTATSQPAVAQKSWAYVAPMLHARYGFGAATGPNGLIYAISGAELDANGNGYLGADVEAYDPTANTWAPKASIPTARYYTAAATGADGRIYTIGGSLLADVYVGTAEAYDPASDIWSTVSSMPTAREGHTLVAGSDGLLYAIGGQTGGTTFTGEVNTVEAYDPDTDTWTTKASLQTARVYAAGVCGVDGRIYVIGGIGLGNVELNSVEAYDPASGTWSNVAPMPIARDSLAAAVGSDGRIYVMGGYDGAHFLNTVEAYDPVSNTWATVASMLTSRYIFASATGLDGRIYAIGGLDASSASGYLNTVEVYTPISLSKLTITPGTVPGSVNATGIVTLGAPVASYQTVTLTSNNPAATVLPTVMVAPGDASTTFTITTTGVSAVQTCTITATFGGVSKSAKLKVRPIGIQALTIIPNSVTNGDNAIGVVTLEAPAAPGGITVTLASNNAAVANPTVSSFTIPAGTYAAAFDITTSSVSAPTTVTITATANGITKKATLKVHP